MPKDFITIDNGFPSFTGNESVETKVDQLYNYTFMLLESLRYLFRNLDTDNFNETALKNFRKEYSDEVAHAISDFEILANQNYASASLFSEFQTETDGRFSEQTNALSKFKTEVSDTYAKTSMLAEYDAIKTISDGVAENKESISGVKATADQNGSAIENFASWKKSFYDDDNSEYRETISGIKQSAADAESKIEQFTEWKGTNFETFEKGLETAQTAAEATAAEKAAEALSGANGYTDGKITTVAESIAAVEKQAGINGAFIKMMVGNKTIQMIDGKLKDESGNAISNESAAEFVMEAANGESEIKLKADRIRLGDGAGVDNDGNLMIKRLWSSGDTANYYAKIYSSYGDFGVYESGAPKNATPVNESCLWGLYNTLADGLSFYTKGKEYLLLKESEGVVTVKPKGTWDFSSAAVTGLADSLTGLAVYFS